MMWICASSRSSFRRRSWLPASLAQTATHMIWRSAPSASCSTQHSTGHSAAPKASA
eukprot:jgi/Astpho2/70/gw1.00004.126.1_t